MNVSYNYEKVGFTRESRRFEKLDGNVLRFTFDGINLPDTTADLLGSKGFVKHHILQMPGNPISVIIENKAANYFDFNDPIIANTTFHTMDTNFIEIVIINNVTDLSESFGELLAYPNPSKYRVTLGIYSREDQPAMLDFYNQQGQWVQRIEVELEAGQNKIELDISPWRSGTYNVIGRGNGTPVYGRFLKVWEE